MAKNIFFIQFWGGKIVPTSFFTLSRLKTFKQYKNEHPLFKFLVRLDVDATFRPLLFKNKDDNIQK